MTRTILVVVVMFALTAAFNTTRAEESTCYVLGEDRENAAIFTVKNGDTKFLKKSRMLREVACPVGKEIKVWDVATYCRRIQAIEREHKAAIKLRRGEDPDEFCAKAMK